MLSQHVEKATSCCGALYHRFSCSTFLIKCMPQEVLHTCALHLEAAPHGQEADSALSWHGAVSHFHRYTCVGADCHAQASEFLLRIITAGVLQQCLCLCGLVTLLTQQPLASHWHYIRPAVAHQLCLFRSQGPLPFKGIVTSFWFPVQAIRPLDPPAVPLAPAKG